MSYKRQMPQAVKDKIRNSMSGRKLSDETKQKISLSVKKAWAKVPQTTELWTASENNNNDKTSNKDESTKV